MKENSKRVEPRPEVSGARSNTDLYLFGLICLVIGFFLGYFFRGSQEHSHAPTSAPASSTSVPSASLPAPAVGGIELEQQANILKMTLKTNPRDFATLTHLGNLYYDHQRWAEAIYYYEQALQIEPTHPDIRTDLGTAYWYGGDAKHAVAEYEKVLKTHPNYPNTLFNLGIVRLDGLKDPQGAIAAWEKLLQSNPAPDQAEKARQQIARARQMLSPTR